MSFDALTLLGLSSSVLCGGFLIALVNRNGAKKRSLKPESATEDSSSADLRT
ncbi:hypothetical protein [Thiorhodococcus mannitoliphagus]|uniref:hypothetical protein n=1 Tax=Thiorhodococcus mannitoliphagus TaxID=329406 RepID=UPI0014313947|nr:hypothetical protein [Thiorhodococcus mannitoliphagus]